MTIVPILQGLLSRAHLSWPHELSHILGNQRSHTSHVELQRTCAPENPDPEAAKELRRFRGLWRGGRGEERGRERRKGRGKGERKGERKGKGGGRGGGGERERGRERKREEEKEEKRGREGVRE